MRSQFVEGRALIGVLLLLAWTATPARAEWFVDLYGGGAFTLSNDVEASGSITGLGTVDATLKSVEFDDSLAFGGRVGYRFTSLPLLALALDAWHFRPDIKSQQVTASGVAGPFVGSIPADIESADMSVTAISLDVMLRFALAETPEQLPQLQFYFLAGPAVFMTKLGDTQITDAQGLGIVSLATLRRLSPSALKRARASPGNSTSILPCSLSIASRTSLQSSNSKTRHLRQT
jgi:hypothetical protein